MTRVLATEDVDRRRSVVPDSPHDTAPVRGLPVQAVRTRRDTIGSRRHGLVLGGILAVQALAGTWVAGRSYFFADDFFYGSILGAEPMTPGLLIRSWFGHLVPGFIALDWTFVRTVGLNWAVAATFMVAVQLAGTLALVRLLTALRGRSWANLAVGAFVGLSLAVTTQALWWGAVVTNLVPLTASIATLGCFVRWVRSGRARHLLAMTVMFGIAVAFYEKSVLTAGYVGLLSWLVVDAGLPWRARVATTLRRWPAWLLLGAIAAVDLGFYASGGYLAEAGQAPGLRQLGAFLVLSFSEGLVPSLFGFLPNSLSGASGLAVVLATNAVVLAVVVASSLRSRLALGGWMFFALGYLLNQGVLGRGRLSMMGVHMGALLRYQLEDVFLFGIALAVALPALAGLGRRVLPAGPPGRRITAVVALAVVAGLLWPWSHSLRTETDASAGVTSRLYFDALRTSLAEQQRRHPDLGFLVGDTVPNWLVYGAMAPFNRFDRVLPQLQSDVPFRDDSDEVLAVTDAGVVVPVRFAPEATGEVAGTCLRAGPTGSLTVPLSSSLTEGRWTVRLRYRATEDSSIRVVVDNAVPGPELRMTDETFAVGRDTDRLVAVAGVVAATRVTVQLAGPGQVCLDGLDVGSFEPA